MWIKFSEKKLKIDSPVIVRFRGYNRKGDSFEDYKKWKDEYLNICFPDGTGNLTHWWY